MMATIDTRRESTNAARWTTHEFLADRYGISRKILRDPLARFPLEVSHGGRDELPRLIRALSFRYGAEIGVWKGAFSERLCRENPDLHLLCVDPWQPTPGYIEAKNDPALMDAAYREAIDRLGPYPCTMLRTTSLAAAEGIEPGTLDFVYIDANHLRSAVLDDLAAWSPKLRAGGIIAGHDYREHPDKPFIQVKAAVDAFVAEREIAPWFLFTGERTPVYWWVV